MDDASISDSIADSFRLPSVQNYPPPSPLYDHYGTPVTPLPPGSSVIPPLQANAVTSTEISGLMAQIAQMQTTINSLIANNSTSQQYEPTGYQGRGGRNGRGGRSGREGRGPQRRDKYCYSHGACAHHSNECRAKTAGHQLTATFENKQGGSTKNCPT